VRTSWPFLVWTGFPEKDENIPLCRLSDHRSNNYQRQQASAAQEAASRLGVDLQILFSKNDGIHQSQQLLDVIQARDGSVSGILVEPASRTAFPKVAQAAVSAGIAWVVLNCEADYLR
jgi:ABC-type sugar transport system substrate-binding protein